MILDLIKELFLAVFQSITQLKRFLDKSYGLINLKPRKMMGYESQGMLLLADDGDGNLSLMQPDSDISNGSVIA